MTLTLKRVRPTPLGQESELFTTLTEQTIPYQQLVVLIDLKLKLVCRKYRL